MTTVRERLDVGLVRRGLARSRSAARRLITEGAVTVGGAVVLRPASNIDDTAPIVVDSARHPFVSRAGEKLDHALDVFGVDVSETHAIDVGSSTGGFTDCLLQRGAAAVVAVDVGTDQLADVIRTDRQVTAFESTDIRSASPAHLGAPFDVVVADLSFISLTLVLEHLRALCAGGSSLIVLVKPQFEVGAEHLDRTGVVRDSAVRLNGVHRVVAVASEAGFVLDGVTRSPITGGAGNVEYLVRFGLGSSGASLLPMEATT